MRFVMLFFAILPASLFAQQTLSTINGWNAYVHLPDDYKSTDTKNYPAILFLAGTGGTRTGIGGKADANILLSSGPAAFIARGWNGNVLVRGNLVKPIIISLQPPTSWLQPAALDQQIAFIRAHYRVDSTQISLTGYSMGGWAAELYVQSDARSSRIASIVAVQAMRPDENPAYPSPFTGFARNGSHWLGYEQDDDIGDMNNIANTMNGAIPGSATYIPVGAGGNPESVYDPAHKDNYAIGGVADNYSIYQYMLICSNASGAAATPPVTSAGADRTISLPVHELQLKGTALPASGSYLVSAVWSQMDGAPAALESDSLSADVSGLAEGVYTFSLTTRDNNGLSASSQVKITVNAAAKHPIGASSPTEDETLAASGEKLTTYPNPARDVLTINWESAYQGRADVMIFDLTGRSLQTAPIMKEGAVFTGPVTVSALTPGAYFLKISLQNGKTIAEKFIKR